MLRAARVAALVVVVALAATPCNSLADSGCTGPFDEVLHPACEARVSALLATWETSNARSWYVIKGIDGSRCSVQRYVHEQESNACPAPPQRARKLMGGDDTESPTRSPTFTPTPQPKGKGSPTPPPTDDDTEAPTVSPTVSPTVEDVEGDTDAPTESPTEPAFLGECDADDVDTFANGGRLAFDDDVVLCGTVCASEADAALQSAGAGDAEAAELRDCSLSCFNDKYSGGGSGCAICFAIYHECMVDECACERGRSTNLEDPQACIDCSASECEADFLACTGGFTLPLYGEVAEVNVDDNIAGILGGALVGGGLLGAAFFLYRRHQRDLSHQSVNVELKAPKSLPKDFFETNAKPRASLFAMFARGSPTTPAGASKTLSA